MNESEKLRLYIKAQTNLLISIVFLCTEQINDGYGAWLNVVLGAIFLIVSFRQEKDSK